MQFSLKNQAAEQSGQESEDFESILLGEDLSMLKSISEIKDEEEPLSSSTESLDLINDRSNPVGFPRPVSSEDECECGNNARPCVSRVIDEDGRAYITIILGMPERTKYLANVVGLIDSASEKDVVDITIVTNITGMEGTLAHRSVLSAIDRCRGTVITRAGALSTIGEVAVWLSGDMLKMPDAGCIFLRQPQAGFGGDAADYEEKISSIKESLKEFSDFIVARGLFTQEEMDRLYVNRSVLTLFGNKLQTRISNLKKID